MKHISIEITAADNGFIVYFRISDSKRAINEMPATVYVYKTMDEVAECVRSLFLRR